DEQQLTADESPDDRLLAALKAIANRGHEGLAALLAQVLEGRANAEGQPLGDAADRPALLSLVRRLGWTTGVRKRFDRHIVPEPVGRPAPKTAPGLGAPAEEWAAYLGFSADEEHPFDQETHP